MKAKVKPHKLLSLLLALVMVVGMLPAMGQVAHAASAVSNLTWDGNTAKWDSDGSASQYRVRLGIGPSYINSTVIANKVVDVTSIDYSSYLLPGNTYYFSVAPIVGSEQKSFVPGPAKTIDGSRGTISPITIDSVKKTATWTSVTGADGYDVWVLRNGAQIGFVRQTTDTSFDCNRQIYQRIDSHGIIVLERSGTFQHYSCLGGTCSDINRAEAPGTAAGMGSRNSRLQE